MILKETIVDLVEKGIEGTEIFMVDVTVKAGNKITVLVDKAPAITIDELVMISRSIEGNLDREKEDFELDVCSPGLEHSLKCHQQYQKNIGRELNVVLADNSKLTGLIKNADEQAMELEETKKVVLEGSKKKQIVTEVHRIAYADIKQAKVVIKFK